MVDLVRQFPGSVAQRPAVAPRSGLHRLMRKRSTIAFLMCLPLISIVVGLIIYPAIYAIYLSTSSSQ